MSSEVAVETKIKINYNSLIVLIGASASGKSFFCKRHFPDNYVSSDECRRALAVAAGLPYETESKKLQEFSSGAFVLFHAYLHALLRHNIPAVADATSLSREARDQLFLIAKEENVPVTYLFFDTPFDECLRRDSLRTYDQVGESVLKRQFANLNRSRGWIRTADHLHTITPDMARSVQIEFMKWNFHIPETAIDVIGDVHGCLDELTELIGKLGYGTCGTEDSKGDSYQLYAHPEDRKLVFVGDLIDRGPEPYKTLEFVKRHVEAGLAYLVLSNHENKLKKWVSGIRVTVKSEFQKTLDAIPATVDKNDLKRFMRNLKPYLAWTNPNDASDRWVIAHAAFDPAHYGKMSGAIESNCIYGPVRSVVDGVPDRIAWWNDHRSSLRVAYGHIRTDDGKPRIIRNTYGIDTGCVHGGSLTALRLPSREIVQVPAKKVYSEDHGNCVKDDVALFLEKPLIQIPKADGTEERIWVQSGLQEAIFALSTRTISPDKLVWLAPTMSPGPVSPNEGEMEDPVATAKFMLEGHAPGTQLVAETKHMGSRGTWRFQRHGGEWEIDCWTKNGYEMFDEPVRSWIYSELRPMLDDLRAAVGSDLIILDSEVMPWNQHGAMWLEKVFSATAASARASRSAIASAARFAKLDDIASKFAQKAEEAEKFQQAVENYCWPVKSVNDLKIGFFDILYPAQHVSRSLSRDMLERVFSKYAWYRKTDHRTIGPADFDWLRVAFDKDTAAGAEGLVLKYDDRTLTTKSKWPQRMLKVRGKEYLRLIYGPAYLEPSVLAELKRTRREDFKMKLAYQETILGDEAFRRISAGESWERVHQCILGILATDKTIVDPRL